MSSPLSPWKLNVIKRFDRSAALYAQHDLIQRRVAKRLMAYAPTQPPARILEIGCGAGSLTALLRERYPDAEIVASDISPAMLAQARRGEPLAVYRVMDGEAPDIEGTFDLIISNMSVQWFSDITATYENWQQNLLVAGGVILTSRPGPEAFAEWRAALNACGYDSGILDFPPAGEGAREEILAIDYGDTLGFLRAMKQTGAVSARLGYRPLSAAALRRACAACDKMSSGVISWQILFERLD